MCDDKGGSSWAGTLLPLHLMTPQTLSRLTFSHFDSFHRLLEYLTITIPLTHLTAFHRPIGAEQMSVCRWWD